MRHLLGRAAFVACALALISQPSFAVPVPKARPHHHDAKTATADVPVPSLRPQLDSDPVPVTRLALAGIPVPLARPRSGRRPARRRSQRSGRRRCGYRPPPTSSRRPSRRPTCPAMTQPRIETPDHKLNCVAYVRERSGFAIQGDAHLWWDHAEGNLRPRTLAVRERGDGVRGDALDAQGPCRGGDEAGVRPADRRRSCQLDARWPRLSQHAGDGCEPRQRLEPGPRVERPRRPMGSRVYPIRGFISARPAA